MSRDVRVIFVSRQASGNDVIRQIEDLWKMRPLRGADGILPFDECIEAGDEPGVPYDSLSELFSIGTDFDEQEPRELAGTDLEVGRVGLRKNQEYRTWADKSLAGLFIVKEEDHELIFQTELDDRQFGELNSWFGTDARKRGSEEATGVLMAKVIELKRVNEQLERKNESLIAQVAEQKEAITSLRERIPSPTPSFMLSSGDEDDEGGPPPKKRGRTESQPVAGAKSTLVGDDMSQEFLFGALEEDKEKLQEEVERLRARVRELESGHMEP